MNADQIDPKVAGWVDVINSYPDLLTIGSCGGHKRPKNCDQVPENEFYVEFRFTTPDFSPGADGWKSLSTLMQYITVYGIFAEQDEWMKIDVSMTVFLDLFFTLRGHQVDPYEYEGWFFNADHPFEGENEIHIHHTMWTLNRYHTLLERYQNEVEVRV